MVAKEQRIERMCRFDPEVDERLVQAAAEDERSIAAEIRVFVREGLDRRSSNG